MGFNGHFAITTLFAIMRIDDRYFYSFLTYIGKREKTLRGFKPKRTARRLTLRCKFFRRNPFASTIELYREISTSNYGGSCGLATLHN